MLGFLGSFTGTAKISWIPILLSIAAMVMEKRKKQWPWALLSLLLAILAAVSSCDWEVTQSSNAWRSLVIYSCFVVAFAAFVVIISATAIIEGISKPGKDHKAQVPEKPQKIEKVKKMGIFKDVATFVRITRMKDECPICGKEFHGRRIQIQKNGQD